MMNPSFTRGEYWLLETVVHPAVPIFWLVRDDMEMVFNKPGHGMKRSLLVETMGKLFAEGLIAASKYGDWDNRFVLSSRQIESALSEKEVKRAHYYGLTAKGGEYWEAFAFPKWEYFIDGWSHTTDDPDIWMNEIACMSKDRLERHLHQYWLDNIEHDVDESSIKWDVLRPWKATYWKELPEGHRVRFLNKDGRYAYDSYGAHPLDPGWYDRQWYRWQ